MANKTKWVAADSPDQPVQDVARDALRTRLDLVWHYLPQAAHGPHDDIELVHQLRVATRRAMAAVGIFGELLSPRRKQWFEKRLRQVRKAAGDARDFDVLAERLANRLAEHDETRLELLLEEVTRRRQAAQRPIDRAYAKLRRKDFRRRERKLIRHVRLRTQADLDQQPSFAEAGRRALRNLAHDFFAAAAADLSDSQSLHAFRIQGKRLRYAMEVFAEAFAPPLRKKLYPQVERLQAKLGDINDHASARRHFEEWIATTERNDVADALRRQIDEETTALGECTARFFQWWTPKRSQALRKRFAELLELEGLDHDAGQVEARPHAARANGLPGAPNAQVAKAAE